jgi:hypothetical protein
MKKLAAVILLCFCSAVYTPAQARDWKKHPAIVEIDTTADIYAVGDPHSDFERLAGVLAAAHLIAPLPAQPDQAVWTGGNAVLVITGDTIDKGPSGLRVLTFIGKLGLAAPAKDGLVILTMGNHEAEFLAEPNGKKTLEFRDELAGNRIDPAHVAACEVPLGNFLCNLPIGVRINDWFFSHGGNTGGQSISQLNAAIEEGAKRAGFGAKELIGPNSILEARLGAEGPAGLPWIYDGDKQTDPQKLLASYAEKLGVHHLVQGHQPGKVEFLDGRKRNAQDLFQRWGLLFLTDTAMSRGIKDGGSIGGLLHISGSGANAKAEAICANGEKLTLWDRATNQESGALHCGK